jgi:hypothetical protein
VLDCSGRGICSDGEYGDGTCACFKGFGGPGCETPCDCEHGTCVPGNSTCNCEGNWTGTRCDQCVPGKSGAFCNVTCFNGVTNGTSCACNDDWVKPQCDATCPKDSNNVTCGGNGDCVHDTAKCTCADPLSHFGVACNCTDTICQAQFNAYAMCDTTTGECVCGGNRDGLTAGCATCKLGFCGPLCQLACRCSGRGTCSRATGACACFSDPVNGFFAGVSCESCQAGYMGVSCQQRSVAVTVATPMLFRGSVPLTNTYSYMDTDRMLYYTGADSINIIESRSNPTKSSTTSRPYFRCSCWWRLFPIRVQTFRLAESAETSSRFTT